MSQENDPYRNFTTKIRQSTHRRLRLLAASRDQTLSDVLTDLIESATLETDEEVQTFKSILHASTAAGTTDQEPEADPPEDTTNIQKIVKQRKKDAKVKL